MKDDPEHHLDDGVRVALIEQAAATPRTARVNAQKVIAVANYLLEWSRRRDGYRYSDESVSQISTGTYIAPGTVRKALAIIEAAGGSEVVVRGGAPGRDRRGSVRRLYLTAGTARAQARGVLAGTARATTGTARATTGTARAQARASDIHPTEHPTARACENDDDDYEANPPPLADTIRAIRSKLGTGGSDAMDQVLTEMVDFRRRATVAPPVDDWYQQNLERHRLARERRAARRADG